MTIETTHVGSLPRGEELSALLLAKDKGEPFDKNQFEATVQNAINEAVRLQREAGVTIVSDGELGKVGYSTYMQERLSGLEVISSASRQRIWPLTLIWPES